MNRVKYINVKEAYQKIYQETVVLLDIRDPKSFAMGHVPGAFHLTSNTLDQCIQNNDFETKLMVMCYHGNSSKNVAKYLLQCGYKTIYSVNGGFADWYRCFPIEVKKIFMY